MWKYIIVGIILISSLPQFVFAKPISSQFPFITLFTESTFYFSFEGQESLFNGDQVPIAEELDGTLKELNFNNVFSYRIGTGIFFGQGFDIGIFYSQLKDDDQSGYFSNDANFITYRSNRPWENWGNTYNANEEAGKAKGNYKQEMIDLEVGYNFKFKSIDFRIMGGLRYAKYYQETISERNGDCLTDYLPNSCYPDINIYNFQRILKYRLKGGGPRFGLSATIPIWKNKISLTASVNWAILFQKFDWFDTFYQKTNFNDYGQKKLIEISNFLKDQKTTNHNFDVEAGIKYKLPISKSVFFLFTFGYKYGAHFGATNTNGFVEKYDEEDFTGNNSVGNRLNESRRGNYEEDIIYHGPFLRGILTL